MPFPPGSYTLGPDVGRVRLRTTRVGPAARVGHDLLLAVNAWSGELTVGADHEDLRLALRLDLRSLEVVAGTGGVTALSSDDRRDISRNALRLMEVGPYPTATFSATGPAATEAGGRLQGTLTLRGRSGPVQLVVEQVGPRAWRGTATVRQSAFGIKPYSAFFGALRLADPVVVEAELALPET
jgi:polyisoprenoid-binding protein YceI